MRFCKLNTGSRKGNHVTTLLGTLAFALTLFAIVAHAQAPEENITFRSTTNLVIVNVEVRDRAGKPIDNLRAQDFEVTEDGVKQTLAVFEFQSIEGEESAPTAPASSPPATPTARTDHITPSSEGRIRYQDRRLMVLYFDFSSMQPAEQIRAQKASLKFLEQNMSPSDLVAVMAFTSRLQVLQDFTADRELLAAIIGSFRIGETSELAALADTSEEESLDTGAAFTADDTEFNVFNTDRKLSGLQTAAQMLASLPEKKALVYFSSGVGKTGTENYSQLRSTINAAVRANVAFYPVDARGLVAEAPAGNASQASARGSQTYSGRAQRGRRERFNDQQDTLYTLASDTGGKSFLDSNDLAAGITQAQRDISSYYILGYSSTNLAEDGRYRRISIRIPEFPKARLDYRSGYFGPKDFTRFSSADKERQLEEALTLGDPITDLRVALEVNYFRFDSDRYFVPVAVKIPGSEFELARKGGADRTRIDFLAQVRTPTGFLLGSLRDNIEIKLAGDAASQINSRQLQYDTGFTLPPGPYTLKFLARENESGKMGTFETNFEVPDLDSEKRYARISSVVLSNQREALAAAIGGAGKDKKLIAKHPLIFDGQKLIPSITRVFRQDQNLFVYFELYNPGKGSGPGAARVKAQVSFFHAGAKAFESEPIEVAQLLDGRPGTLPVEFQIPLDRLKPGSYDCQVSVIDELGRKFAFQRAPIVLLPAKNPIESPAT